MVKLEDPLDLEDSRADAFLEGIQGNIIKGHGRDFTRHLLLRMTGDPAAVGRWIARYAAEDVTSAKEQQRQRDAFRVHGGPGERFAMFLLSPDGYRHLGFADDRLPTPKDRFNPPWGDRYFPLGMKRQRAITQRRYKDPPWRQWEVPYQGRIDAMVLLADDLPERLDRSEAKVVASLPGIFETVTIESGSALKQEFPHPAGSLPPVKKVIEHFGFQDGVSQPLMIKQDLDRELRQRGSTYWNPIAPLSLALVREPDSPPDSLDWLGSFMVFRKLEQDVKAFWDALGRLADQSTILLEDAGAMAVGRYRDGTPRVPTSTIAPEADPNDFQYGLDPRGQRCPFHAHIRKTNPRGDLPCAMAARGRTVTTEFERARRIARRAITYGPRPDLEPGSTLDKPSQGVGLLFMCFQSNLDQFVIQQEGSDGNDFVRDGTGFDAVIGQFNGEDAAPIDQTWPTTTDPVTFKMVNFVRMRGGEYFFAPSMRFLKGLGQA
jgi:Dyp-type peroxidase family